MHTEENYRANKLIAEFMGHLPRVEFAVGKDDWICYSPANVTGYYTTPQSQEKECERWIANQNSEYPDSDLANCQVRKFEWYRNYHLNWQDLMEVWIQIANLNNPRINVEVMTIGKYSCGIRAKEIGNSSNEVAAVGMSEPIDRRPLIEHVYGCIVEFVTWASPLENQ